MVATAQYYRAKNNFLASSNGIDLYNISLVNASLKSLSQFKSYDELKLPFLISGRLVTAKKYKDSRYGAVILSPEALKSTVNDWVGIQIYKSHAVYEKIAKGEDVSVDDVVGKIVSVTWNTKDNGIDFVAEIYDKPVAYKMDAGLIKFISVGFARLITVIKNEYYFTAIEPKEASLVFDPRDDQAEFKPLDQ